MHRWWYADDKTTPVTPSRSPTKLKKNPSGDRKWKFQVLVTKKLHKEEKLAVTGDCDTLGNWEPNDVLLINPPEGEFFLMICFIVNMTHGTLKLFHFSINSILHFE